MEPSIYLIKVNVALIVLYAFYKFSFSKDTFFRLRRGMLLLICATSLIYPFIDFSGGRGGTNMHWEKRLRPFTTNYCPKCWSLLLYLLLQQKLSGKLAGRYMAVDYLWTGICHVVTAQSV